MVIQVDITCDNNPVPVKQSKSVSFFSSMLTLDITTLFYYTLSQKDVQKPVSGMVKEWRSIVDTNSARPSSKSGSIRSLSVKTQSSMLVSTTQPKLGPKIATNELDDDIEYVGGLSDKDETLGAEWEAALLAHRRMASALPAP